MPGSFFNALFYKALGGMSRRQNVSLRVRQTLPPGEFETRSAATKPRRGRNTHKSVAINPSLSAINEKGADPQVCPFFFCACTAVHSYRDTEAVSKHKPEATHCRPSARLQTRLIIGSSPASSSRRSQQRQGCSGRGGKQHRGELIHQVTEEQLRAFPAKAVSCSRPARQCLQAQRVGIFHA